MSEIRMFSLVTGQTVIGLLLDSNDTSITLDQPLGLQYVNQNGGVGVKLVPYNPVDPEGSVKFSRQGIVSEPQSIPADMAKAYTEQTSRIQIVSALDQMEGLR